VVAGHSKLPSSMSARLTPKRASSLDAIVRHPYFVARVTGSAFSQARNRLEIRARVYNGARFQTLQEAIFNWRGNSSLYA
jgi:hypothetical protein